MFKNTNHYKNYGIRYNELETSSLSVSPNVCTIVQDAIAKEGRSQITMGIDSLQLHLYKTKTDT